MAKSSYHPINNADSMWSRSMSSKKAGNKGGKEIQKMLGIEDQGMERASVRGNPLSLMAVLQSMYEDEEENGNP